MRKKSQNTRWNFQKKTTITLSNYLTPYKLADII